VAGRPRCSRIFFATARAQPDARLTFASRQRLGGRGYLIAPEDVRATLALYQP
jgi:hypothetical protein